MFPQDILQAIMGNEQAWKHYQCFSEAYRRIRVAYIDAGRARPEVFEARLRSFLRATEKGKQLGYVGIREVFLMCSSLPEREEAMLASELWRKMVVEEHAQSDARRGAEPPPSDHWAPFAANFAADPHRSDDQLIGPLGRDLEPTDTLMDVGAGGGRHALPLALHCQHVVAVEPSPSMCAVLLQLTSAHGIKNVTIVQSKWEDADVEPADVVISTHVAYVVRDIAGFVRKMDLHARKMVRIVLYPFSPQSEGFEIWERVHGEKRLALPGLPQLLDVMEELKIPFESEPLSANHPRSYSTPEQALEQTARRLYVQPGDPKMREIELAFEELLIEEDGSYRIKDAPVLVPHMVSWSPATAR